MCVVLQNVPFFRPTPSWQGRRCALPLHPSGLWRFRSSLSRHAPSGRCITSQGKPSSSPDTPMTKGAFRAPLEPIEQGAIFRSPLASPIAQPYADWMRVKGSTSPRKFLQHIYMFIAFETGASPISCISRPPCLSPSQTVKTQKVFCPSSRKWSMSCESTSSASYRCKQISHKKS